MVFYIKYDNNENVYSTEDILNNILNPKIIAKYKIEDNKYILIN